ncbi:3528_t:CDS:2, partial [Gigaspora margarita]
NHKITTWGKLSKRDLELVLEKYKKEHTKGYYLILQFWADIAAIHCSDQILINSCKDVKLLKHTTDYISKLLEQQIKEIILKSEQRFKSNIINNYSKISQSKLPLWFSEGLKKLESYKDELFNVPIMNPIFCNIIDISKLGVKIWHQIFDKNQIKLLVPDKIFEFSFSEYDNIYSRIKNWVNPLPVMSESYYVEIYIYQPLQIILQNLLYYRIHLFGPEHETKCSFERRSWHYYPPHGDWPSDVEEARNIFDIPDELNDQNITIEENVIIKNQPDDEPVILLPNATILLNGDSKPGITYIRVYSKKVDTALTYTYKKNKIAYLLIVEAKLPNVPFHGVYDKLLRSINDAINSFLIYIAKDAKIITRTLENLLTKLR